MTLEKLSINAVKILTCALGNRLSLNVSKTKSMIFGAPVYVDTFEELGVTLVAFSDRKIEIISAVRSLWVTLDFKLSWNSFILYVCKKANSLKYRLNQLTSTCFPAFQPHALPLTEPRRAERERMRGGGEKNGEGSPLQPQVSRAKREKGADHVGWSLKKCL